MIGKESTLTLKPSPRRTRTKLRKPKFLSLRLQLISTGNTPPPPMPNTIDHHDQTQLINLFPLHPENLVEQDKLDEEHNMAACIFSSCDDDGAATTLTGILCSDDDDEEEENTNNPSSSSVNYADEEGELVRTAMRRNKTDGDDRYNHHEKWVCYSEVVERKKVIRGLSSSSLTSSSSTSRNHHHSHHRSKLVLKLDYEKIMNSWVNKGPLYIHNNSDLDPGMDTSQPQTVPDLHDDDFFLPYAATPLNGTTHDERDNGSNGGLWTVPEIAHNANNDMGGGEEATQASHAMIHNREASVQRYKEKRRNRLFAKTIRYEVRKLNAEKRPRIKGRFVKRN